MFAKTPPAETPPARALAPRMSSTPPPPPSQPEPAKTMAGYPQQAAPSGAPPLGRAGGAPPLAQRDASPIAPVLPAAKSRRPYSGWLALLFAMIAIVIALLVWWLVL
jgi:hypothetical protein